MTKQKSPFSFLRYLPHHTPSPWSTSSSFRIRPSTTVHLSNQLPTVHHTSTLFSPAAMAPSGKNAAAAKDRRKSSNTTAAAVTTAASPKPSHIVTLKVPPQKLRAIVDPNFVKEDTPVKQSPAAAPTSGTENASDSTPNSPPADTPAAQSAAMGPPAEGPKKKGVKRSATAAANGNGEPKARGKPGPKKKQKL